MCGVWCGSATPRAVGSNDTTKTLVAKLTREGEGRGGIRRAADAWCGSPAAAGASTAVRLTVAARAPTPSRVCVRPPFPGAKAHARGESLPDESSDSDSDSDSDNSSDEEYEREIAGARLPSPPLAAARRLTGRT